MDGKLSKITIKHVGIIYVVIVLVFSGIYYFSLSPQSIYLRENRWINDETTVVLKLESEIPLMFVEESETERVEIPQTRESDIQSNTDTTPISDKEEFVEIIERFKATVSTREVENYLDSLVQDFFESEEQYTAALSTTHFFIEVQQIQRLVMGMEPLIISKVEEEKTVYTLFMRKNNRWELSAMGEDINGAWVMSEKMIERYTE
jgi:hypothetical protein